MKLKILGAALLMAAVTSVRSEVARINVDLTRPGHKISPMLWGIFFEDINLSADGGIYPELVRNRSFEDSTQPEFWTLAAKGSGNPVMSVDSSLPLNAVNRHYLQVKMNSGFKLENGGYWGMNVVKGGRYQFKAAMRGQEFSGPLAVKIVGTNGAILAAGKISSVPGDWEYRSLDLTASGSDASAKLQISASGNGTLLLDMVSLMPEKTWKNHGLRPDLAEALDALQPAFMRFPGGNWIEGDDLAHMYHWKTTIGPIDSRKPLWNTWGYNTTQGLGFEEYLQLCEDLDAEPVFGINCGMSLHSSVPLDEMGAWIQGALDAIEYANGPTNSIWGAKRAAAGHPAPFHLKYMEIGNENGGPDYSKRWALMVDAIRAKYPGMKLIATSSLQDGSHPTDPQPDIVDEHYYESPESFMRRAGQYDDYDRHGPKIFIGEYAVTEGAGEGNLRAAIGEAAFMTGMERNSDIVEMASYAPLFVNLNHRAWNPDLINFDSSRWYGIPSYYVQQMFSCNRGDVTLPVSVECGDVSEPLPAGCVGVGTWNTQAEFRNIKVTAPGGKVLFQSDFSRNANGWKLLGDGAQWGVHNGVLQQTAEKTFIRALAGSNDWTDYTLELEARKISGAEGFLILFHINNDDDRTWWNLGGWNNTRDALEFGSGPVDDKPGRIETGQWYDIKVEVKGRTVKCWLNGQLVHHYQKPVLSTHAIYASASRDEMKKSMIVKVVNTAPAAIDTEIAFNGVKDISGTATATVLTSSSPYDENSIDNPTKVSPKMETFKVSGTNFDREFPGNSFTVLRLPMK
ncbi:MAG TPA: alpha-L-arabinofuranosidase C-terminal domain-containing protein [Verrucomicrobiae bacterium]|nr:alpha-L-arabinofuranosidase C-terminal domain-containing protein [Verrucomicrobiae bacterium]